MAITFAEMDRIRKVFGEDYLLDQLGEECAELIQAASKVKRVHNGSTPVTAEEAHRKLMEEIADVECMIRCVSKAFLDWADCIEVNSIIHDKERRMMDRVLKAEKAMEEHKSDSAVAFE